MASEARIPHSLRIAIFFLRLTLGAHYFWMGWNGVTRTPVWSDWVFLVLGAALVLGLATRVASIALAVTVLAGYWTASHLSLDASQLLGTTAVAVISLVILFIAKAGSYIGLDYFFRFSLRGHKN